MNRKYYSHDFKEQMLKKCHEVGNNALKLIYTAVNETAATLAMDDFEEQWGQKHLYFRWCP